MRPDSPELDELIVWMAEGASESDALIEPRLDVLDRIRQLRLGAVRVPVEQGGSGWTLAELFAFVIRMAASDPNITHVIRNHYAFVESQLGLEPGEQRTRWLGEITAGKLIGSASGEATISIGSKRFGTVLAPDGDGFLLSGTKMYCTGSPYADWITVLALTPDERIVTIVVPREREGLVCDDDWDGIGQRLSGTCTVHLDRVRVNPDEVLGARSSGSAPAGNHSAVGSFFQLYLTGIVAGITQNAADDAATMLRSRGRTFTHAPTETAPTDPHLLAMVGTLAASAFAARATVMAAVTLLDRALASRVLGIPDQGLAEAAAVAAAEAKIVVDRLGVEAGSHLYDVAGASATRRPLNLDRHWRNARTLASHNPPIYKAQAIGDLMVNAVPLPTNGYF